MDEEKTDPNLVIPTQLRGAASSAETAKISAQVATKISIDAPANAPIVFNGLNGKMPELGALSTFMKDPTITEIMINDIRNVMVEREGKLVFSGLAIGNLEELNRLTRNILEVSGRVLTPEHPYIDLMLADGSRVNIITTPLTQGGPCITIRKFPTKRYSLDDLVGLEMLDKRTAYFLNACIVGKLNVLIAGGTNSGKTTLLNSLTQLVPKGERIIAIEDTPELVLAHANSVRLQTKPQTPTSSAIQARELLANSLRMRPDRIIVGECRRGEAFDLLQAMNTGHGGSMATIHANSPRDALSRMETLCLLAATDLPLIAVRKQINSALDLVVQVKRFRSGKRRVTGITEITGVESETITTQDIFVYETDTKNAQNADAGHFKCTGFVPTFLEKLAENGVELPKNYFA
jgi:pilus assembly protein CpaF